MAVKRVEGLWIKGEMVTLSLPGIQTGDCHQSE